MQPFISHLNFPTSIALSPDGSVFVAESGLPFDGAPKGGRVLRIGSDGNVETLISDLRQPLSGLLWHDDGLIISEGGYPGRISRFDLRSGERVTILDHLPGFGNYHTNMVAIGPDGKFYFSQGAMTNSGVIGADSHDLAWLQAIKHNPDIPGYDIDLADYCSTSVGPDGEQICTGAFARFGTRHPSGTRLSGQIPCTASVMRCNPDGSHLELVCWGIRNAYGLLFLPDGRLLATDQGTDVRGVRPVWNCPDFLYEIKQRAWYGWPDFLGADPIDAPRYQSPNGTKQPYVLQNHGNLPVPERPLLAFSINACAVKMTLIPQSCMHGGDLIVAQFGDERPMTAPSGPRVGRNLVRISTRDWQLHELPEFPLQRPIDVAFSVDQAVLYVVDFGEFEFTKTKTIAARAASGCIWKIPVDDLE